jgi:cation diffusion facilitator CzcD-associated flavoprotein CzcO
MPDLRIVVVGGGIAGLAAVRAFPLECCLSLEIF